MSFAAPFGLNQQASIPAFFAAAMSLVSESPSISARRLSVARASSMPFSSISGFGLAAPTSSLMTSPLIYGLSSLLAMRPRCTCAIPLVTITTGIFALQRLTASTAPLSGTLC